MPPRRRPSSRSLSPPPGFPKKHKHLTDGDLNRAFGRCRKLLDKLLKHKDADLFDKPVDARDLGIPDYYSEISNPMDLGTVDRRLKRGRYETPLTFAEDVRLVFRNAMTYNYEGDYAYESAFVLSSIFESEWASILTVVKPRAAPPAAERRVRLQDELPRLPAADGQGRAVFMMNDIGGCLRMADGKVEVDFSKADEATLGKLEQLFAERKAARTAVGADAVNQDP